MTRPLRAPVLLSLLAACGSPPEGGAAQILPDAPVTTDDLSVEVTEEAVPRNDKLEISYTWSWYVDDQLVTDLTGETVPAARTAKGETWRVVGVAFDGKREGLAFEAQTTILNTAPVGQVSLAPASPRTSDVLTATATATDADEDEVTWSWSWSVDGQAADGLDGPTVSADRTARGEVWVVTAVPNDGESDGEAVTAQVEIGNTAPEVTSVAITPSVAYTNTALTAVVEGADLDGDAITYAYQWFVDGAEVGSDAPGLPSSFFTRGRIVTVEVTPSDDADVGVPVLSEGIEIQNSPPSAPALTLGPVDPWPHQDLVCEVTTPSTDADGDAITYTFGWTVDGERWEGATGTTTYAGDTIDGEDTEAGQEWVCTATASDGLATGPGAASATVTVAEADYVYLRETFWILPEVETPSSSHAALCAEYGLRATPQTYTVPDGWSRALYEELTTAFGYRTVATGCCVATMWCTASAGTCMTHNNSSSTFYNWGYSGTFGQGVFTCIE